MSKANGKKHIFLKVILGFFIGIISIVVLFVGGLNVLKFAIYSNYYGMSKTFAKNPGLNDGYITQGVAISEEKNVVITSGYMTDKSNSRIYVVDLDTNEDSYVKLVKGEKAFTGHVGGVAITGDNVYIANGSRIYTVSLNDVLEARENHGTVDVGEGTKVNNAASFVFTDESNLYVGEFHDGGAYVTNHPFETPNGEVNHAIITKYSLSDLTTPLESYSIINKVQGFCITGEGKMVFSTSYGLSSSHYYIYDKADLIPSSQTVDGVPLYFLGELKQNISGPAMSEDLDYTNGKVLTLTESASNKYIFGKLFFATHIDALEIA